MNKVELTISVVGMRHRVTPSTLQEISEVTPLNVELRREPKNYHDENAIAVHLKDKPWEDFHIGYVTRQVSSEIAPRLDRSKLKVLSAKLVSVDSAAGSGEMKVFLNKR